MKSSILAAAILFSLAGPASVLAEVPSVTVTPPLADVVPVDSETTAQQVVTETLTETDAPVTEIIEPQPAPETAAEMATPATEIVAEQAAAETPLEAVVAGAGASAAATPRKPCPSQGKGMMGMGKGMGQGGKPGCMKPCCRHDKGQPDKHEQVVRRLDMIEARIAKMEAMLESLMQR